MSGAAQPTVWTFDDLTVEVIGSGWVAYTDASCLLIDPGDGFATAWGERAGADAVLVTAPERAVGLYALLHRLHAEERDTLLRVHCGPNDEITAALVAAWLQSVDSHFEIAMEVGFPGGLTEQEGDLSYAPVPTGGAGLSWMLFSAKTRVLFLDPGADLRALARYEDADLILGRP